MLKIPLHTLRLLLIILGTENTKHDFKILNSSLDEIWNFQANIQLTDYARILFDLFFYL